jgi:hypothetical protein
MKIKHGGQISHGFDGLRKTCLWIRRFSHVRSQRQQCTDSTLCQTRGQAFDVASVFLSEEGFDTRREDTDMCRREFGRRMFMTVVFRQKAEAEADRCAQLAPKL